MQQALTSRRRMRSTSVQPRLALALPRQSADGADLYVHVTSHFGWALKSRRRPTGLTRRRGKHLIRQVSTVQACDGLSSVGPELYASTRGACTAMGMQSHKADWRVQTSTLLFRDSLSARAAMQRKGRGGQFRVSQKRNLELQAHVAVKGHIALKWELGVNLPADVPTTALSPNTVAPMGHTSSTRDGSMTSVARLTESNFGDCDGHGDDKSFVCRIHYAVLRMA